MVSPDASVSVLKNLHVGEFRVTIDNQKDLAHKCQCMYSAE